MKSNTDRPLWLETGRVNPLRAKKSALIGALAALGLSLVMAAPALAATYSITDLGSLGNGYTVAKAINNNGQVTGYSSLSSTFQVTCPPQKYGGQKKCFEHPYHAFLWEAGTMKDLGTLGGNFSEGFDVNDLGEVVGSSQTKTGSESFLYRNGKMTGLGTFGASAINDLGVLAGSAPIPGTNQFDAAISQNGKITDLGSLSGVNVTNASDMNGSNEAIGTGDNSESDLRAWIWRNGTLTDIGTLGGPQTAAYAINDSGQIVGFSQTSTDADHGFVWQNGKMTDIGLNVFPYGINGNGVIVGSGGCGAAVIIIGGVCQNLQNLIPANSGVTLFEARAINDKGQIIASAQTGGGEALVLTPTN